MDTITVIVILSLHLVTSGCLLLLIGQRTPQGAGLGWFGLACITYGLALACRLKLGIEPIGLASVVFDAGLVLAMLLFHDGLRVFMGGLALRPKRIAAVMLGYMVLASLSAAAFGAIGRHAFLNLTLGSQQLGFALFAFASMRVAQAGWRVPLLAFGGTMGLFGASTLLRGVLAATVGLEPVFFGWLAKLHSGLGSFVGVLLGPLALWMVFVRLNTRLAELATHDQLTGLLNRAGLDEVLERHYGTRVAPPLSVLQLDLDHFKRINDAHGHGAGDRVLRAVAAELNQSVRLGDFVARTGGEEFLIGCVAVPPDAGATLAARLCSAVAALRIEADDESLQCTISIGVSLPAHQRGDWEMALRQADDALYAAKQAGRDRVVLADGGAGPQSLRASLLAPALPAVSAGL